MLKNRGSFPRANTELAREAARQPIERIAAQLREHATSRFTPPTNGPAAPLTDLCAHTADMTVPLGRGHDIATDEATVAFDMITGFSMFFVPRGLLRGVQIAPDDIDRTWGDGSPLTGAAGDILLATLGRRGFADKVGGAGGDIIRTRLAP